MKKTRRSLISRTIERLRGAWQRRRREQPELARAFRLEFLEPRQMLNADPTYDPNTNFHIHAQLDILIGGQQVVIPKGVGNSVGADSGKIHTHDFSNTIHIHPGPRATFVTLDEIFDTWLNDTALGNPNAVFSSTNILGNQTDASHVIRMYVNGVLSTDFEAHKIHDGDKIVISYDLSTTAADSPTLNTIANQTVLAGTSTADIGAPLWIPLDGFDPNGGPLTYTVQAANPSLFAETLIPTGNRSLEIDVIDFGKMTFQLFDNFVPRVTNRIVELVEDDFYDKTATNEIKFHRVVPNFVIQGGDPTGTGSGGSTLGDFDDQFNFKLQHTSSGLLSMAKSTDDTNDSQFFVTDAPTRSLDFNHSIFGRLTDGEEIRDAINSVPVGPRNPALPFDAQTNPNERPLTPVVINTMNVVTDTENGVLMLRAAAGASGTTNVMVTVTDQQGHSFVRTFQVTVSPDTSNGAPFLNDIVEPVRGVAGQPITLQLSAQDVEGNPHFFDAVKPTGEPVAYTVTANNATGLVTINPPANFVGTFNVLVGVSGATQTTTTDAFDTQLVQVTVAPAAPTVDLGAASDSGISNSDNITNAGTLQFEIGGVSSGAVVKLFRGQQLLTQGTATGTTITLSTAAIATAGEGSHQITATQTVGGVESDVSTALTVTYDITPPAAFTSTPPTEADVGVALQYNAENPDENAAGFRYELVTPPAGAAISTAGVLNWTPTAGQVGTQSFGISAIDAAGNVRTQSLSVAVTQPLPPKVDLVLELETTTGQPLTSLSAGQSFVLKVLTRDLRSPSRGVFSAYMDILWDSTKATVNGPITFSAEYPIQRSGTTTTPGLLDEVGGVGSVSSEIGPGLHELFRIPMVASGSGTLTFVADPADILPAHDALLYGDNAAVNDEVRFGSATVTINASFNAVNDTFNVNEDAAATTLNPLTNDTNIGGNQNVLTITAVGTTTSGGTVTIAADGKSLLYTPAANFNGTETFTYTARNQNNETNTATITVQVQPVNDAPTGVDDAINVPEDSTNFVLDVLANDLIAPDTGETLRVTQISAGSAGGTLTIGSNGANIRYTPAQNFLGTETFTYTLSDRTTGGLTDTATVTLTVAEVNDPPVATNDTATVAEESDETTINVVANDTTGPDTGETISVTAVGTTSNGGTVSLAAGGQGVIYKPAANFQGVETFTYTLTDSRGGTATGTVTVTVTNANDPPTAVNDTLTGFRNTTSSFDVLANDTSAPDPAENLIVDSVTQPAHGTVAITDGGKKVSYTPTTGYTGPDSFTYIVRDPGGLLSTAATVNINVAEFAPSVLSGFVYFDVDNDGVKDAAELPLAGVTITLTGTTVSSQSVNLTVETLDDGSYRFENLAPGNYTLAQSQPSFTIDGQDTAGSQGGTVTNNQIAITNLAQGTTGINNNFGERGRALSTFSIADLFSSNSRNYAIAAFDSTGNELWHSMSGPAWQALSNAAFSLSASGQLRVQALNSSSQMVAATVNTTSHKLDLLGEASGAKLFRLTGGPANFTFAPVTANQAPTAVANSYTTSEDAALNVPLATGLLANDTDPQNDPLTASVVTQPTNGTLSLSSNGTFTYTPNPNFAGTDTFTYRASDGTAQSAPATVTITVTAVNDAPAAVNDAYTASQNTALAILAHAGVLRNDTDVDSTLTATVVTQPAHGTLTLNTNGSFTYTPQTGYTGADSFTYRASDGTLNANATVNLTVTATNQAPTAAANTFTTNEDTALSVPLASGLLANDSDPEGNPLSAVVETQPANGTLTLNANGTFTYTPNANFAGTDTFTYRATDGAVQSTPATVTITITAVNDAPAAVADAFSTTPGTPLTRTGAQGVLANDTDIDSTTRTATLLSQPANGTVTMQADGGFTYTPNAGFTGTNTFTYRVSDGTLTSDGTVTITVAANNVAPEAEDDNFTTNEDVPFSVSPAGGVLANDTDANAGNSLTAIIVTQPTAGMINFTAAGSFTYTPPANFSGTVTFTYKANDGTADSNAATVTITVNPLNDAPLAVADSYVAAENTLLTVAAVDGVLKNDTDVDNTTRTAIAVAQPQHGALTLNADGSFTYDPDDDYRGPDSFTYKANDGAADSNVVTVTIDVNGVPAAMADSYQTDEDSLLTVAVANGVLDNDTDPENDPLTASVVAQPAHGTLTFSADGSFTYDPEDNFHGSDTFTYRASDGTHTSVLTTVALTVNSINDAPAAGADSFTVNAGGTLNIAAPGVLANDTDADGDMLTAVFLTDPANGTLVLTENGSFTYTPDAGFTGTDTFTYRASDGALQSANTTVTITVNAPPTANNDVYQVNEDGTLTVAVADGLLDNDTDPEGDDLTATVVAQPLHGALTLAADGSFVYTPEANFHGEDGFSYQASDGSVQSDVAAVTITVLPVNDAPDAVNDVFSTPVDAELVIAAPGVLQNDTDADGNSLTATIAILPANGSVTLNSDGSFTYTPNAGFHGTDTFTYTAGDAALGDTATVTIHVNGVPLAADDAYQTDEDALLNVLEADGLLDNDSDPENDALTVLIVAGPAHGTLTPNTNGAFLYDPADDYSGPDSFTYKVNDGLADSAVATVTITVNPVNDAPLAAANSYSVEQNGVLNIDAVSGVLANDTDVDGPALAATVVTGPTHGMLTLNSDGSFTYTPTTDYLGPDSFVYQVGDGSLTSQATVSLTVHEPGEGEAAAAELALLSFLSGEDDAGSLLGDWEAAADQAYSELGSL